MLCLSSQGKHLSISDGGCDKELVARGTLNQLRRYTNISVEVLQGLTILAFQLRVRIKVGTPSKG